MGASSVRRRWVSAAVAFAIVAVGITAGIVASATAPAPQVSTLPTTPALVGLSTHAAIEALNAAGLSYSLEPQAPSPGQAVGAVLAQSPAAGTVTGVKTRVTLLVARPGAALGGQSQVPPIGAGGRLLSAVDIADHTCTMTPARPGVSPSISVGVAISHATSGGLMMIKVTSWSGGPPRAVAFYGMLQCSTALPRHRALVWLVEYPNAKILSLNGPCCIHPTASFGTMFVVVNPRSGIANENFGGPGVAIVRM